MSRYELWRHDGYGVTVEGDYDDLEEAKAQADRDAESSPETKVEVVRAIGPDTYETLYEPPTFGPDTYDGSDD